MLSIAERCADVLLTDASNISSQESVWRAMVGSEYDRTELSFPRLLVPQVRKDHIEGWRLPSSAAIALQKWIGGMVLNPCQDTSPTLTLPIAALSARGAMESA